MKRWARIPAIATDRLGQATLACLHEEEKVVRPEPWRWTYRWTCAGSGRRAWFRGHSPRNQASSAPGHLTRQGADQRRVPRKERPWLERRLRDGGSTPAVLHRLANSWCGRCGSVSVRSVSAGVQRPRIMRPPSQFPAHGQGCPSACVVASCDVTLGHWQRPYGAGPRLRAIAERWTEKPVSGDARWGGSNP